jgi:hypothetical protein
MTRLPALPHQPKTSIFYAGDEMYDVQIGDEVEFLGDGQFGPATYTGEITAIQSKNRTVRVRYLDETDWTKDGEPKQKAATVPVAELTLIMRSM